MIKTSTVIPKALCVGDVMLDIFSEGHVSRISPEAPVPVLRLTKDTKVAGGAANVARNFAALGGEAHLIGVIGDDSAGQTLEATLSDIEQLMPNLIRDISRRTIVKQRFTASGQQMLRADIEDTHPLQDDIVGQLEARISQVLSDCDVVLVSDYAKGLLSSRVMDAINTRAKTASIPVLVDPKTPDWSVYGACTLIKPNAKELSEASGLPCSTDSEIEVALRKVSSLYAADIILVTRAEKGMSTIHKGHITHLAGQAKEVFDVSGAGDTVLSSLGYGLATTSDLKSAMQLAVRASGIVVGKRGTATVDASELEAQSDVSVFDDLQKLVTQCEEWRAEGLKIGFTNGCFDLLHAGHLHILDRSKAKCDRLIVGVNSDASVKRLKGPTRPIKTQDDRAAILARLKAVDAVILFEEDTPARLIEVLNPAILAKGGDYTEDEIVGADHVKSLGGEVVIISLVDGKSTTNLVAKMT